MKKIKKILYLIILSTFLLPLTVLANDKITLKVDKSDLSAGDVVTVDAVMPEDLKLYALTATLNYDKNVFEEISNENFVGQEDVTEVLYNPGNQRFGLLNKAGEIPSTLFSVRLRVKKNAQAGNTNIALTNISSSDGENKIDYDVSNVEVLITRDAKEGEVVTNNDKIEYQNTEENIIKTFSNKPIVIGASIGSILLLICLIYLIVKKQDKKIIVITGAAFAIFVVLLSSLLILNNDKKDVNDDGQKDYNDAKEILKYLIDMQGTEPAEENETSNNNEISTNTTTNTNKPSQNNKKPNKSKNKYDVNNDGKVDINDAGSSTENTTEKTKYTVYLKSRESNDNLYVEKGEITIEFSATVSPNEQIKEVMINGKYYKVTDHKSYYTVTLNTSNNAGVQEFKFTKVKLANKREIKSELNIVKEVLKDEPYVDMFNFNDKTDTLTFNLVDKEQAFMEGYILVEDKENKEILREKLSEKNSIQYDFEKEQDYTIMIFATYDRDSNKLNNITGNKNYYEEKAIYSHILSINSNYDFKITDLRITDAIEKGEKPVIEFTSTNNKGYTVEYIEIDGHRYNVSPKYEKNQYHVELTKLNTDKFGKYHLNIDKVEISNYKVFTRDVDYQTNELSYTVLKNAPSVENITLEDDHDNEQLYVNYDIIDNDQTLENLNLSLYDSNNKLVTTLTKVQNGDRIPVSYKGNIAGGYQVKFLADYNLGTDRHSYSEVNIGEKGITTQQDVKITSIEVGKINQNNRFEATPYPTKNQAKYQIKINVNISPELMKKYNRIAGVTINGINYDGGSNTVNNEGNGGTTITLNIPDKSGIIDLRIDRVKLAAESYQGVTQAFFAVVPQTTQIDVLKDKPYIENLQIIAEDYDKGDVTFRFYIKDDNGGFENGTITLDNDTKTTKIGENEITFNNVSKDKALSLIFNGNYDLDTNTLKDQKKELNYYQNDKLYETTYSLYSSEKYSEIKLTNLKTNSDNNDNYFEKLENINLQFDFISPDSTFIIDRLITEGKEYKVTKNENTYHTTIDGYNTAGIKDIIITDLILTNGKKISLKESNQTSIEVLKDKISIYDFKYEDNEDNIKVKFNLKDNDTAIFGKVEENIRIDLYNEDDKLIKSLPFNEEITIPKDGTIRYYIKVYADYDRDIKKGESNYFQNILLLDEVISLDKNYIEVKKITDVTLYKNTTEKITEIETVTVTDIENHPENYFVKIQMEKLPTIYAKIKKVLIEKNHLYLILDYEYVIKDKTDEKQDLRIDFGIIENNQVTNSAKPATVEQIIDRLKKDPSADISLGSDIDFSKIDISAENIFDITYTGTFNGNGYKIKGLDRPLFKAINNGTIKNIKIDTATIKNSKAKGLIANESSHATISGVIINKLNIDNCTEDVGGLIGHATNQTLIEKSKINVLTINASEEGTRIGGLVGTLEDSKIQNSIVNGTITSNANYIGGLVGNALNSELRNNVAGVTIKDGKARVANIVCYFACSKDETSTFIDNVTVNGEANNGFANNAKEKENNYNIVFTPTTNTESGVTNVEFKVSDPIMIEYFKKAHFDEKIWYLTDVMYYGYPSFKFEKSSVLDLDNTDDDYDETKEYYLYKNLLKLTPFYDSNKIIKNAKNIDDNSLLATKTIKHLIPIDVNGNIVTYLTTTDYRKLAKIKIVYEDDQEEEYDVRFDKVYDMVASYRINSLKIDYTFNHYLIDSNSQLVNNLTNYLTSLDYDTNLDPLTPGDDSRIYKEFYNDVTKKELREFILKYISITNNINSNSNEAISDYLEREIKNDDEFIKTLYVYNYFRRFYDVSIDGMKLYDFILFDASGYDQENMSTKAIVDEYLKDSKNFDTNRTNEAYNKVLSKYTTYSNIPLYLEHLVTTLSDEKIADWFAHQFKGYLVEIKIENHPEIEYRLWDHIKNPDTNTKVNWYNYALPILTLPERSAYIITTPGQFIIGAQRTYINDPFNEEEQAEFKKRVAKYTARMSDYYHTAVSIIDDEKIFNNIHTIQIDKRFAYENGILTFQSPYSTEEPFHKNFNEVIGQWAYPDGNAATANGAYIIWRAEGCLDGDWTYSTWSHETAHNMDARLFLINYGRRFDAGGEDYADGNLTQSFNAADIVMNLSMHYSKDQRIAANLEPSRINSKAKIKDFYEKVFDTVYIMDYIEGQAFLALPPEEQAMLVVQVSYPREETNTLKGHEYLQRQHSFYSEVTVEDLKNWNLQSISDIYDHKLVMFPGVIASTYTTNRYGGENILKVRWYQPHNDYGRPDSYSLKWWAYEMLGYAGYDKGYIGYYSNINSVEKTIPNVDSDGKSYVYDDKGNIKESKVNYKTDLMALQEITGDKDITFKKYRMQRFDKVKNNLQYIQVIDVNDYFVKFYKALHEDAINVANKKKEALEKYPGDTKDAIDKRNKYINDSKVKSFAKSSAVRQDLYFELKMATNDFEGKVYDQSKSHPVTDFIVPTDDNE